MRFLRCARAEFLLVFPRLARTRFGISLLALCAALLWLGEQGFDSLTVVLQASALGAIVGTAFLAGHEHDRPAILVALTHPTSSLAIATGRWMALFAPAAVLTVTACVATGRVDGLLPGLLTAAAVGGCTLGAVLLFGSAAAFALFICMAVAGSVPPERLVDLARPGVLRLTAASALELGPALWHYRDIAHDLGAVLHAVAWTGLGILLSSAIVSRHKP
ncbi:MAG TPA: hypothetical protein VKQ05_09200 [Gemmatimonadales bacterium]|nr:hypothetical protein [Gemmatimonadales bacterium]